MKFDFIIVGQGICGTFLSYYLLENGFNCLVVDNHQWPSASRIASGVINPVTGRRIVKTWMIDEVLPAAKKSYMAIGSKLGIQCDRDITVLDFHTTAQMRDAFEKREKEETFYLHDVSSAEWQLFFNFQYGIGAVSPALWLDIRELLENWREYLLNNELLLTENFDERELQISDDFVRWHGYEAGKIIYCDGVAGISSKFWHDLPFAPNKGEAIIAKIDDLSSKFIYKKGLSIVPWDCDASLFWIGSTYNWQFDNELPTPEFRRKVESELSTWLKLPFEIVDHFAAIRPANTERRPFVGWHPLFPNVGILNGMGTKGCSLAPFFAQELVENLCHSTPINALADVKRFFTKTIQP